MAASAELPTRERLVASTIELLQTGGYAAASVGAIAERAGVANGTLYRHFSSKAELFVEVFRAVCGRELAAMRKATEGEITATAMLDAVISTFATRALRNRRLAWALLAEPVDPLVDAERLAFRRTYRDDFARVLLRGIESGELPDQDVELTSAAVVGAIGEALVGPISPVTTSSQAGDDEFVAKILTLCRRAAGVQDTASPKPANAKL